MTKYIITDNARELNIALYQLSVLDNTRLGYFKVIEHPDTKETAFEFAVTNDFDELDTEILIHPNCDTTRLKELTTAYTPEQEAQLDAYINSIAIPQTGTPPPSGYVLGRLPFRNLVEGYIEMYDQEYMKDNGWNI